MTNEIGPLRRLLLAIDCGLYWVTMAMLVLSGCAIAFIACLATADIIGVNLLGNSIASAIEMQEATAAIAIVCAMAAVQANRANIEVDLVTGLMPPRLRRATDALAGLCGTVAFGVLAWQGYKLAMRSWNFGELNHGYIDFPIYPFKIAIAVGFFVAMLQFVRLLMVSLFGSAPAAAQVIFPTLPEKVEID